MIFKWQPFFSFRFSSSSAFPSVCDSRKASPAPELSLPSLPTCHSDAAHLEAEYVHRVYDSIAPHFSSTRHSPWPRVCLFLSSLAPGSMLADVGCGNGKYLGVNPKVIAVSAVSFWVTVGRFSPFSLRRSCFRAVSCSKVTPQPEHSASGFHEALCSARPPTLITFPVPTAVRHLRSTAVPSAPRSWRGDGQCLSSSKRDASKLGLKGRPWVHFHLEWNENVFHALKCVLYHVLSKVSNGK